MNALEDRVRAQLLAERQAAAPPPDLEAQLLYALHRSEVPARRAGIFRQVALAAAVVGFASLVAFGFSRLQSRPAPAGHAIPTASASESTSATPTVSASGSVSPSATAIAAARPATADELTAMVGAGKPGAERDLGIRDCGSSQPGPGNDCFAVPSPKRGTIGTEAGYFLGARFGSGCWVYLYHDSGGWHYVNVRCGQATGYAPTVGADDQVYVTGCANTRTTPGLGSPVVDCLPNGTVVHVTNGPAYSDGKLWWRLQGHGWMAHDFLISPA